MKTETETKTNITACVYTIIHIHTPHINEAELFITNCPEDFTTDKLKKLVVEAGYYFGWGGREWVNYGIKIGIKDNLDLKRQFINRKLDHRSNYDERPEIIEVIDYEDLVIKSLVAQSIN